MIGRNGPVRWLLPALVLLVAACSDDGSAQGDDAAAPSTTITSPTSPTTTTVGADAADPTDHLAVLPEREGPRRETTHSVPHVQIDAVLDPEVDAELRRRAFSLPGVEDRQSEISLPGARSLWLADDLDLERPDVLLQGREFAHIHPNGSLHVWMPVDRALEVAETKWGEFHPWVGREDFWDGLVMVYTPETLEEVDVTIRLVVDAYNYVTGADLDPSRY